MTFRATIHASDLLSDHLYSAFDIGHRRSLSCDSYTQAPDNIPLKSNQPVRSSKATFEIRGRSCSSVSASKSRLSGTLCDEYHICKPESRESSRVPFTEQKDTKTFTVCSRSPIFHSLIQNGVENTQRPPVSPKSGQDIDGKDCHVSGYRLRPQGDYASKPKVNSNKFSKTVSIYDEAKSKTKENRISREAMQKAGSSCKSDLNSDYEKPDDVPNHKSADEVLTSGLRKFDEIFRGCDAEKRFNSDPKKCLLNTKKGQRCGGQIPGGHKNMAEEVLASLANLYFEDNEQECIHQLRKLAELAVCKRNHRETAKSLIDNLLHDHGSSIVESVMDRTDYFQAGASGWGSSTVEKTCKPSRTSSKKKDAIPDDTRMTIQIFTRPYHNDRIMNIDFRYDFRPTTRESSNSYFSNFQEYKPRKATKSSTTEWLKKQIIEPFLPVKRDSGWLYVYWNCINFGFVKIGYTTVGVDQRIKQWVSKCKHEAEIHACSEIRVPHVRRLEQIVHAEFKDFRYHEINCHGCGGNHIEWFQLPIDEYRKTRIEKWIQWMLTDPYEEIQGVFQLKSQHADKLGEMLQVQEVNKQLKIAVGAKQKGNRTRTPSRGKLRTKSKVRQIKREP